MQSVRCACKRGDERDDGFVILDRLAPDLAGNCAGGWLGTRLRAAPGKSRRRDGWY